METGQVHSGKNNEDTYLKILKQLVRITGKEADGIASRYPNVMALVKAFGELGPLALENVPVSSTACFPGQGSKLTILRKYLLRAMRTLGLDKLRVDACTKFSWIVIHPLQLLSEQGRIQIPHQMLLG